MYHELKSLMHEVLLLLGMFALGAPRNAEALRWRWAGHPTMLHRLCDLPFAYYAEPRFRSVLFPTLLCACYHDSVNLRILSSRLSPAHLLRYLRAAASPATSTAPGEPSPSPAYTPPAALIDDPSELPIVTMEYSLPARLPPALWIEALRCFSTRPVSPDPVHIGVEMPRLSARGSETSV